MSEVKHDMPAFCLEEHLDFLDAMRRSGVVNMFCARSYLIEEFGSLSSKEAGDVLSYWMKTFPRVTGSTS